MPEAPDLKYLTVMKPYRRNILLAILIIAIDYGLILLMRVITPKNILLRSIIIYLIFQSSMIIYYLMVRPKKLRIFTSTLMLVFSVVVILITWIQHALVSKDLNLRHIIPLALINVTILITHWFYQWLIRNKT
jgi:hypothetical protein